MGQTYGVELTFEEWLGVIHSRLRRIYKIKDFAIVSDQKGNKIELMIEFKNYFRVSFEWKYIQGLYGYTKGNTMVKGAPQAVLAVQELATIINNRYLNDIMNDPCDENEDLQSDCC